MTLLSNCRKTRPYSDKNLLLLPPYSGHSTEILCILVSQGAKKLPYFKVGGQNVSQLKRPIKFNAPLAESWWETLFNKHVWKTSELDLAG